MPDTTSTTMIKPPRTDVAVIEELIFGIWAYPAVLVAHELGLFALLAGKRLTLGEICSALNLKERPAHAIAAVCTSLGLLEYREERFELSAAAEDYLLEDSPTYYGGRLDFVIRNYPLWSVESLKRAVLTDAPQIYGGAALFEEHAHQAARARDFTRVMHSVSMGPALAWPAMLDLSSTRLMLDIGGGSGAHSIGATLRWPALRATVLDIEPVCAVAREFAERYKLQDRIEAMAGDFWTAPLPPADLHFYSMIFHDWEPERCRFLAAKSFDSLPPGGRIVIHELLFNDERTGPFPAAAYNIEMLLFVPGRQYSGRELSTMLAEVGFSQVEVKPTWSYWSIVSGVRP